MGIKNANRDRESNAIPGFRYRLNRARTYHTLLFLLLTAFILLI